MAGSPATTKDLECPLCHEDYTEPKMLPCTHLACRKCVVSWLEKAEDQGGCPLCRVSILPSNQPGHGDLATLVDDLPTDLATVALVESHKILRSPHICRVCENNVVATSFCLQCDVKLCKACSKGHNKLPALKNHVIEEISKLTPERLAAFYLSTCKRHDDRPAELYCSSHHELICMLCASTNHRSCPEVKAIAEMATEKRAEMEHQAQRLRAKEKALSSQIREVKDRFKAMRKKVKDTFDDLQQSVKKRRLEVNAQIQAEEDAIMTSLSQLEKNRTAIKCSASTVEKLVTSAPDIALLDMLGKLTSRLSDLELHTGTSDKMGTVVDVTFESQKLSYLKSAVSTLGRVTSRPKSRHGHSAKVST